jgi:magnesium transporter
MQTTIAYNEKEVKERGSKEDIKQGYNIWVDLTDPSETEIQRVQELFSLDVKAIEAILNKSKKPQIRILDDHSFTIILSIKYKDLQTLITDGVYLFLGKGWLVTIHSSDLDLMSNVHRLFEEKNKRVVGASIDALYYSIISEIVDTYEQLLTAIELTITDFEQRTLYRPTRKMLEYLDTLSRQIIVLRRHFWHVRDILNFLIHAEKDQSKKEGEVKYIEMAYDNITQLIQLVESYRDTINSTRDLYMANISLQMNDTMRVLAIFSAIVLPLTFISGVYGMNGLDLNNINSLPLGFAIVILTMVIIVGILFLFFKKKQWILVKKDSDDDELLTNKKLGKSPLQKGERETTHRQSNGGSM